jgi:hypothetical protein
MDGFVSLVSSWTFVSCCPASFSSYMNYGNLRRALSSLAFETLWLIVTWRSMGATWKRVAAVEGGRAVAGSVPVLTGGFGVSRVLFLSHAAARRSIFPAPQILLPSGRPPCSSYPRAGRRRHSPRRHCCPAPLAER